MQNHWEILGIESGADLRAVKRAYAAKLKTIRQDENPAEFMALREAYESAKGHLARQHVSSEDTVCEVKNNIISEDKVVAQSQYDIPQETMDIMGDVQALMHNPWEVSNLKAWQNIFDDERLDSIDEFSDFE